MLSKKHQKFMRLAIARAKVGIENGQTPFGACIVKDGHVIACEHNSVWASTDITAHAEIRAIRKACAGMATVDLSGCVIYATCEPCPMCFCACHWAKIDVIVFGASIGDAAQAGFSELDISNEYMKAEGSSPIEIIPGFLQDEAVELFREWSERPDKRTY
ncbi:nucleoside deaminase [Planctomycetota bacterium]